MGNEGSNRPSGINPKNAAGAPAQTQRQTSDAVVNGQKYKLIAFYFPDDRRAPPPAWDKFYNYECLGNFWVCPSKIILTAGGITGTFHTTEAAFQATKWWKNDSIRKQFELAPDGPAAISAKKFALGQQPADDNRFNGYAGLGQRGAMMAVLRLKFADPTLGKILLDTGDAYLLEHNSTPGRDRIWSDNHDGTGTNYLGISLMDVRAEIKGSGAPIADGTYNIADFTRQVKPAP